MKREHITELRTAGVSLTLSPHRDLQSRSWTRGALFCFSLDEDGCPRNWRYGGAPMASKCSGASGDWNPQSPSLPSGSPRWPATRAIDQWARYCRAHVEGRRRRATYSLKDLLKMDARFSQAMERAFRAGRETCSGMLGRLSKCAKLPRSSNGYFAIR